MHSDAAEQTEIEQSEEQSSHTTVHTVVLIRVCFALLYITWVSSWWPKCQSPRDVQNLAVHRRHSFITRRSDVGPEPYGLAVRGRTWSRPVMSYDSAYSAVPTLHEQVIR